MVYVSSNHATERAIAWVSKKASCFAELLLSMDLRIIREEPENPEADVPERNFKTTAYVQEGRKMVFNELFIRHANELKERAHAEGITHEQFPDAAVAVHEIMHVVLGHLSWIIKKVDMAPPSLKRFVQLRCNVAADLAINQHLPKYFCVSGLNKKQRETVEECIKNKQEIPEDIKRIISTYSVIQLRPEYLGLPEGKTAKEYYDLLPKDENNLKRMLISIGVDPQKHQSEGQFKDLTNPLYAQEVEKLEADMENKVLDMHSRVYTRGTIPALIQQAIERILAKRQIPWNLLLRRYVKTALSGHRKLMWKRPCRRLGLFPSRHREKKHKIVIAIDTSGSTIPDRAEFAAEIESIYKITAAEIEVVECDAAVSKESPFKFTGKFPDKMTGGGGTAFLPVFEFLHERRIKPDVLIYLTDGYGENPQKPDYLNYPVIWVTTGVKPAQWGKVVEMKGGNSNNGSPF